MLTSWQHWFGDCEPVAHQFRDVFRDRWARFHSRWARFHSLPESKRYPENDAEYEIVLHRHNRVLGELAHNDEPMVLLTTGFSEATEPVGRESELNKLDPHAKPWRSVTMHRVDANFSETCYWHVFANEYRWKAGLFDQIVRRIADGSFANIMIVACDCTWLLHPYDGGMDVIMESAAERDKLMAQFSDWRSTRTDGL